MTVFFCIFSWLHMRHCKSTDMSICYLDDTQKTFSNKTQNRISTVEIFQVDLVVGEPYFQTSMLPWHHIQFWHSVKCLSTILHPETIVLPCRTTILAVAVDFIDLWKIKAPIGNCEGFDLDIFDKLIEVTDMIV